MGRSRGAAARVAVLALLSLNHCAKALNYATIDPETGSSLAEIFDWPLTDAEHPPVEVLPPAPAPSVLHRLRSPRVSPAADLNATAPSAAALGAPCPAGCSTHGTCHRELGRCDCPPGYGGPACLEAALPACTLPVFSEDRELEAQYTLPCSLLAPKTCACAEQCAALQVSYYNQDPRAHPRAPPCLDSPEEVLALLKPCENRCSHHGWCNHRTLECECFVGWEGPACADPSPTYCTSGCSARGECRAGTCVCDDGFYGADCSQYRDRDGAPRRVLHRDAPPPAAPAAAPAAEGAGAAPRVYVYDLPPSLTSWLYYHASQRLPHNPRYTVHPSMCSPASSYKERGCAYHVGQPELFLHERLLASPQRTLVPEEADFFFVPALPRAAEGSLAARSYYLRVIQYIRATWPFWDQSQGADHLFVVASERGMCDGRVGTAPYGQRPPELARAILLTHWGEVLRPKEGGSQELRDMPLRKHGSKEERKAARRAFMNREVQLPGPCFLPGQDIVIPPPISLSLEDSPLFSMHPPRHPPVRDVLLYFAGALAFKRNAAGSRLRNVREALRNLSNGNRSETAGLLITQTHEGYTRHLARSVFCVSPAGYNAERGNVWSIRTVQALVYGCIPVIVQDSVTQPFESYLPYNNFALRVPESEVASLPARLRAMDPRHVQRMQMEGACVAERMLWSSVYGRYGRESGGWDAFSTLMQVLGSVKDAWLGRQRPHFLDYPCSLPNLDRNFGGRAMVDTNAKTHPKLRGRAPAGADRDACQVAAAVDLLNVTLPAAPPRSLDPRLKGGRAPHVVVAEDYRPRERALQQRPYPDAGAETVAALKPEQIPQDGNDETSEGEWGVRHAEERIVVQRSACSAFCRIPDRPCLPADLNEAEIDFRVAGNEGVDGTDECVARQEGAEGMCLRAQVYELKDTIMVYNQDGNHQPSTTGWRQKTFGNLQPWWLPWPYGGAMHAV